MQYLTGSNRYTAAAAVAVLAAVLAALVGCSSAQSVDAPPANLCEDPRPQVCTLEYAPVCAVLGNKERREYSNGCSACAQQEVVGYEEGPCPGGDS